MYDNKIVSQVLSMYLAGASVWEICDYFEMGDVTVNEIIDKFAPYL